MGKATKTTEVRGLRLEKDLLRIADKLAERSGLTFNAYIRSLLIEDFLLSGDPEATSYAINFLSTKAKEKVKRKVLQYLGVEDIGDAFSGSSGK